MKRTRQDMTAEQDESLTSAFRRMTQGERLALTFYMSQSLRDALAREIQRIRPEADEHEVKMRVASHFIEAHLMREAFDWDPDAEGL